MWIMKLTVGLALLASVNLSAAADISVLSALSVVGQTDVGDPRYFEWRSGGGDGKEYYLLSRCKFIRTESGDESPVLTQEKVRPDKQRYCWVTPDVQFGEEGWQKRVAKCRTSMENVPWDNKTYTCFQESAGMEGHLHGGCWKNTDPDDVTPDEGEIDG